MNDDYVLLDLPGMLSASKRTSHREKLILIFRMLICFLQDNNLTARTILHPKDAMPDDIQIRRSDLTFEGSEFYKQAEQKWLSATDCGTSPTNTTILVRELNKIRKI